jgi:hypothetical protein
VKALALRVLLILYLILYIYLFNWLYIHWLAPTFGYMGMTYHAPSSSPFLLAWVLALLPGLWMPFALRRPSQIPFWFLYLLVYIPSLFSPQYMSLESRQDLSVLIWCFFSGFLIISLTYSVPPIQLRQAFQSPRFFWGVIVFLALVLNVWVLAIYHSKMRLVGFSDVYNLRSESDVAAAGSSVEYAVMLLSSVINPLFMAHGLVTRKKSLVFFGFLDQLLLYSAQGSKAVILSVFVLAGLYFVIRASSRTFGLRLTVLLTTILVALSLLANIKDLNPALSFSLSLLFQRTFANGGYMTGAYANFFHSHPVTYLSSVHGIGAFVHYPYDTPLGLLLGNYELGIPDLDLNAHFWASDGIAAFGPIGIVIISVICATVFWILDSCAARHDIVFASLMVAFITSNLLNVSLFTTLVSGGLGFVILLMIVMPSGNLTTADSALA